MDGRTHQVLRTFPLPGKAPKPMGVAVSPDAKTVYVTTGREGTLAAIDVASGQSRPPLAVGRRPWGVAISADGKKLFTANGPSDDLSIVDAATMRVISKVRLGQRPWGVAAGS